MTTIIELETELKALQSRLDKLKKAAEKPSGVFTPELGTSFFFIGVDGPICIRVNVGSLCDKNLIEIGNVFPTEEAAIREVEKRKVIRRLAELAGGWKPDWGNAAECKYCPYYHFPSKEWRMQWFTSTLYWPYAHFPSSEVLQAALDELGDRMNYLLEV